MSPRSRMIALPLGIIAACYLVALLAPVLAPFDPTSTAPAAVTLAPSWHHPLGTDGLGRDLLSRVLFGGRISLALALLATAVSLSVGTAVGAAAGYAGGGLDALLMRVVDAGLAIPRIFFVLVPLALWERTGWATLIPILGLTGWFSLSRVVRTEVQSVRRRGFVSAAQALGLNERHIVGRHVLPNVVGKIVAAATLGVAQVMLIEAGLSYLGLGVPSRWPSWGTIIADGQPYLLTAPWIALAPGLALVLAVLAFAALGERVEAAFQPARQ